MHACVLVCVHVLMCVCMTLCVHTYSLCMYIPAYTYTCSVHVLDSVHFLHAQSRPGSTSRSVLMDNSGLLWESSFSKPSSIAATAPAMEHFQSQLRQKEGELSNAQNLIASLEKSRSALMEEVTKLTAENGSLSKQVSSIPDVEAKMKVSTVCFAFICTYVCDSLLHCKHTHAHAHKHAHTQYTHTHTHTHTHTCTHTRTHTQNSCHAQIGGHCC